MLERLQAHFPQLTFVAGNRFYWSPDDRTVYYDHSRHDVAADWALLHETGHALLEHQAYNGDFELLKLELAAWRKARELATMFEHTISEDHIQDCLDTYRDWLYKRSICPTCTTLSLQHDPQHYRCFNCHTTWRVSASRFCRAYRATKKAPQLQGSLATS